MQFSPWFKSHDPRYRERLAEAQTALRESQIGLEQAEKTARQSKRLLSSIKESVA